MKYFLLLVCSLFMSAAWSQTAYIVDKEGWKTIVRDDAIEIILIDKRISYKIPGKTWEKYIKYKDLDYAVVGSSLFKTFRLDKKSSDIGLFVHGESDGKTLASTAITYTTSSGSFSSSTTVYTIIVIDNKTNTTIEKLNFKDKERDSDLRAKAAPLVRKYFSDCSALIQELDKFDHATETNDHIMDFFNEHIYINCK